MTDHAPQLMSTVVDYISLTLDVRDNDKVSVEQKLKDSAKATGLYISSNDRYRYSVAYEIGDANFRIEAWPHKKQSRFVRLSWIPSKTTDGDLQQIMLVLKTVLGNYFSEIYNSAKITRVDIAFDLDMDINCVYFDASHFQVAAIADSFNFQSASIDNSFVASYRGTHLATNYIGSEKSSSSRIVIYDKNVKNRKDGKKLIDVRGRAVRIEFKIKPRNLTKDKLNELIEESEPEDIITRTVGLSKIRFISRTVDTFLGRLSVYRLKDVSRVREGSVLHMFLLMCRSVPFKAAIRMVKKDSKERANRIQQQLVETTLPTQEMSKTSRQVLWKIRRDFKKQAT